MVQNHGERGITPEEIRSIRERLGLTQSEAGELIGGGPRAFTKYEAGTVKPSASVINLLRVLDAHPNALAALERSPRHRAVAHGPLPFEITADDIERLTQSDIHDLLRRLLRAEALANDLPMDGIHVSSAISHPDGGEDGRIAWTAGPTRTPFLPGSLCQFQAKAGKIAPAKAADEALKPMVRQVLESGGHYIVLCGARYVQQLIERREDAIRNALRDAGIDVGDQIDFRDADRIADWVNHHSSVAVWVKERTRPGTIGPFRSWSNWSGRAEHAGSPWFEDDRLDPLSTWLHERIAEPRGVARLVGPWGIGKTRLALEALNAAGRFVSDLVMYAVDSESAPAAINDVVQSLSANGTRAIVVVDECSLERHRILTGMVSRSGSQLSLITIDDEIPSGTRDDTTLVVSEAPLSLTEAIVTNVAPHLESEDSRRIVRFSKGFPKIAIRISQVWGATPVTYATDEDLVDAFVLGRRPTERDLRLRSASLLATFGLVRLEPQANCQLPDIARLARHLTADDLLSAVTHLIERGAARRRGGYVAIQPRPIALKLAELQWKDWSADTWEDALTGPINSKLRVSAARQLALLNDTAIANDVARSVCRNGGPLDSVEGVSRKGNAEVLSALAEVDTATATEQIERILGYADRTSKIRSEVADQFVKALEMAAFDSQTFESGARLLLRLAVDRNVDPGVKSAAYQFRKLFPVILGSTAADGNRRLALLDEFLDAEETSKLAVVAEALVAGSDTHHFSRTVGAEIQGSRPALTEWRPVTRTEIDDYIEGCVSRLGILAERKDEVGASARCGLAECFRSLIPNGFIHIVEDRVHQMARAAIEWPAAHEALGTTLVRDGTGLSDEVVQRVEALITELRPSSLQSRVRFVVTEMPWDYPYEIDLNWETRHERQVHAIRCVTHELVAQPELLRRYLHEFGRGQHRMACVFGEELAKTVDAPNEWLEHVLSEAIDAPEGERNYDLLSGYLAGMAESCPELVDASKRRAARSPELAPGLPMIYQRLYGYQAITASDIRLLIDALEGGRLDPQRFGQGFFGAVLTSSPPDVVAPLLDAMIGHSATGFAEAVHMIGTYTHDAMGKLDALRPQVRNLARSAAKWTGIPAIETVSGWFADIMEWVLAKGRGDLDACATALALARALAESNDHDHATILRPLVPALLSGFPEIVWQLVGPAIISGGRSDRVLRSALFNPYGLEPESALRSLPEDTLFAWCYAHRDRAPAFAAQCLVFPSATMTRLLNAFGDDPGVLQALEHNMGVFMCWGSAADYLKRYVKPLRELLKHRTPKVRTWAARLLRNLQFEIEQAKTDDEERDVQAELSK